MKLEMKRAVAESVDASNQARLDDRVVLTSVALGSPRADGGGGGGVSPAAVGAVVGIAAAAAARRRGRVATRKGDGDGGCGTRAARGWTGCRVTRRRAKANRVAVEWR